MQCSENFTHVEIFDSACICKVLVGDFISMFAYVEVDKKYTRKCYCSQLLNTLIITILFTNKIPHTIYASFYFAGKMSNDLSNREKIKNTVGTTTATSYIHGMNELLMLFNRIHIFYVVPVFICHCMYNVCYMICYDVYVFITIYV